jgi:hypothetical protein
VHIFHFDQPNIHTLKIKHTRHNLSFLHVTTRSGLHLQGMRLMSLKNSPYYIHDDGNKLRMVIFRPGVWNSQKLLQKILLQYIKYKTLNNKLLIYKAVIKPIWNYGIELWNCSSTTNIVIMQRSLSKILRAITNAPRYVTNHTLHTDFNIPTVSDVVHERNNKYHNMEAHPNPLLRPLLQTMNTRRLKWCWPFDLQGTWGDIAGWTSWHVIVIQGIEAYFV